MNVIKPEIQSVVTGVQTFFKGLGLLPSMILVVVLLAVCYYAFDSVKNGIHGYETDKKVAALQAGADKAQKDADVAKQEADQFRGAAAAYKQQADQLNAERAELINANPALAARVAEADKKVQSVHSRPLQPVTDDMRQRVTDVGSKLDNLYPNK